MSNENKRYGDIPDDYIPPIRRPRAQSSATPPQATGRSGMPSAGSVRRPASADGVRRPAGSAGAAHEGSAPRRQASPQRPASAQNSTSAAPAAPRAPQRRPAEAGPVARRSVARAQTPPEKKPTRSSAIHHVPAAAKGRAAEPQRKPAPAPQKQHSEEPPIGGAVMSLIKAIIYIILVVAVSGLISYYAIVFANDMYAFVKDSEEVEVTIPEYATVEEIADILGDAGVVEYPDLLVLYAKLKKIDKNYEFVAGTYTVNGMMNYDELFYAFVPHKSYEVVRITIPEGFTIEEMITLFTENGIGTREGFIDAINNYPFDFDFVKALDENPNPDRIYRLEGYLYPDTYEFYKSSSEATVIYKLLKRFNTIFSSDFYEKAEQLGYSVDQVLTLASMIEKEARYAKDYETVSSVFHNRLGNANFPCLESDATIMYAIQIRDGERKTSLDGEDLAYDTPYNSYLYRGLPPGPIANPGYEAITCALWPAKTKYYYFVSDNYGNTYFAKTNAEHNENKAMVKRINESGAAS